jgi:Ca-activated chloride channel family protein
MKILLFLLVALIWVDPATVKKINSAKSAAENAFRKGDYQAAIHHYKLLVDSLGVSEDEVVLNLANAYFLAKDTANAFSVYHSVTESTKTEIRSKANQQLGIMANQQGRPEEALNFFKQAIRAEPSNDDARYNYEMLKKKLEEKKKEEEQQQQQDQDQQKNDEQKEDQKKKEEQKDKQEKDEQSKDEQNKDQLKKDQQQKDQQEKEQEEKEKKEKEKKQQEQKESEDKGMQNLDREKLEQMKISEEKARMILEAMKNQEKQYLQQQKRKPTQSRDRNKPDW